MMKFTLSACIEIVILRLKHGRGKKYQLRGLVNIGEARMTDIIAKNLLLNHTCDTCSHVSNYGCLINYGKDGTADGRDKKSIPTENTCKSWEQAAIEELQPLYEKRELVERPDVIILHGQKAVLSKLEEILKKAAKEVMIAAPEFVRGLITSSEFPLNVLENAVEIRLMVAGKAEDWLFLKGFSKIDELRVRDNMFGGGVIADSKEAMLFLGEEQPNLVIWSNHLGLVRFAREYFQFLWDTSAAV